MKFNEIFENVIDSSVKFKGKRSSDFAKKISNMASEVPDLLKHQEDLEAKVAEMINDVSVKVDKSLAKFKLELAPVAKEYKKETTILDLMYFHSSPGDEHFDLAKQFYSKHKVELDNALKMLKDGAAKVKAWSDEQKWPTGKNSLSRFTRFDYLKSRIRDVEETLKNLESNK